MPNFSEEFNVWSLFNTTKSFHPIQMIKKIKVYPIEWRTENRAQIKV